MHWYLDVLKKYAVFSGRARRKEYWMFCLFNLIIGFVIGFIGAFIDGNGIIALAYNLAILLPSIAVSVRRLHDTDRSGWWMLIGLIPIVGPLVLIFFMIQEGTASANRFGANPK